MWNTSDATLSTGPPLPGSFLPTFSHVDVNPTNRTVDAILTPPVSARLAADNVGAGPISAQAGHQLDPSSRSERSTSKRKVRDRELPTGKSLIDMYSKRSASLIHKGEELAHLTHAYVLVFTARPESIGEGNHRLFVSDEFKNADADLVARINTVTRELNGIALELAQRAGWEIQRRKKRRSDGCNKSAEVQEPAISTPCTISTSNSSSQNQSSTQLPSHIAAPNPAGDLTVVPTRETSVVATLLTSKLFGMEQKKIESVVRAVIKSPLDEDNLDVLHDIAQSELGVRAIDNAHTIPLLVSLLNKSLPLAGRSALILTSMMHHWTACVAILLAGAIVPLVRLLSRDIGSEVVKSIAHASGCWIPPCPDQFKSSCPSVPAHVFSELIALLGTGNMEVRLAAAQVIQGLLSAKTWCLTTISNDDCKSMALGLCRLVFDCGDLSQKELIVSAISAMRKWPSFDTEIEKIAKSQILPPLILLLDDTNPETAIAACRILRKPLVMKDKEGDNEAILQPLTCLLSHPDDEVFVEAAWTASVLTWHGEWDTSLPESFPLTTIQRLSHLLRHPKQHVVACALHSIADARCLWYVLVDFLLEMADGGGVRHVISLVESGNLDVAETALLVVRRITEEFYDDAASRSVVRHFLQHGVIEALLRNLVCDPSPGRRFQQTWDVIAGFWHKMEKPLVASTTQRLIHLLPSLENSAKMVVLHSIMDLMAEQIEDTHLLPYPVSLGRLLQLAQVGMDSRHFLKQILEFIRNLIIHRREWHDAFRAAGAESFLTDPELLSRGHDAQTRGYIQESLDSLHGLDIDTDSSGGTLYASNS